MSRGRGPWGCRRRAMGHGVGRGGVRWSGGVCGGGGGGGGAAGLEGAGPFALAGGSFWSLSALGSWTGLNGSTMCPWLNLASGPSTHRWARRPTDPPTDPPAHPLSPTDPPTPINPSCGGCAPPRGCAPACVGRWVGGWVGGKWVTWVSGWVGGWVGRSVPTHACDGWVWVRVYVWVCDVG